MILRSCALLCLLTGCANYDPQPLDEAAVLQGLREIRIELPPNGLTPEDAVAIALVYNPGLDVVRREHQVAAGLVLSEGVWTNPEFRPSLDNIYSRVSNPLSFALDLRVFPAIPGETDAKVARAEARARSVLADLETAEKALALRAHVAHAQLLSIDKKIRILEAVERLHDHVTDVVVQRLEAGAATVVDRILAQMQREAVVDEGLILISERKQREAELAALLGVQPGTPLLVRENPIELPPLELDQVTLEDRAVQNRPDLRADKERFDEQEQLLRLTHLSHAFWPRFLQTALGGLPKAAKFGVNAGIEIPIFDSGAEDIAVAEARRDQARSAYRARLHQIRGEIHESILEYQEQERRNAFLTDRMAPLLQESDQLMSDPRSAGIDPVKLVAIESRVLKARRSAVEAELARELARLRIVGATGGVFCRP